MMTALDHPLVQDYLRRLRVESSRLPADEAHDLETQIREHLSAALGADPTEVEVRETLDRLGEPAVVVEAAGGAIHQEGSSAGFDGAGEHARQGEAQPDGAWQSETEQDSAWREVAALVGLVGATLLFWLPIVNIVLWLGGIVLLILARRWSVADKLWGALVLGAAPWLAIVVGMMAWVTTSEVCETDSSGVTTCTGGGGGVTGLEAVSITLAIAFLVLYVWTVIRLARKAARAEVSSG